MTTTIAPGVVLQRDYRLRAVGGVRWLYQLTACASVLTTTAGCIDSESERFESPALPKREAASSEEVDASNAPDRAEDGLTEEPDAAPEEPDATPMFGVDTTPDALADIAPEPSPDAPTLADAEGPTGLAPVFDGATGYVEIADSDVLSEPTAGALTVEAWIRPDSLAMPHTEGAGYVHWLGKGVTGQHEWVARMHQQGNSEGRENRISFYAFNLTGGLGAGSYFQDALAVGEWIHYVGEFDAGHTYIYKNGELRDSDPPSAYNITPMNGTALVRIATRDLKSFFQGAIARVAIYGAILPQARVLAHYQAKGTGAYDDIVLSEATLVAFWKLDEASGTVALDSKSGLHGAYHGGVVLGAAPFAP